MITPAYAPSATERILPRLALDFTTAIADARVTTVRGTTIATRFNNSGLIEVIGANLPRFDFDPSTLLCKGQLIEETRTNLFLNSLVDGSNLSTQSVTLSAVAYTMSFYGSGSVTISGGHSATVTGVGDFPNRKTYTFTPTAGSSTFTVSGDVKFAQLEAGVFPTSFIPTAVSAVVRNKDDVSMTGTNFSNWFNASEGAFAAWFDSIPGAGAVNPRVLSFSDGTANNRFRAFISATSANMQVTSGGSSQVSMVINSATLFGPLNKLAFAYKLDNFAGSVNASTPTTDTSGLLPVATIRLNIGSDFDGSNNTQINGHIQKILYWPQRITNAEVQAFSE